MPFYTFRVSVEYITDEIYAENSEQAREIADAELDFCGEGDVSIQLISVEND